MNAAAFDRLLQPAMLALTSPNGNDGGGNGGGSGEGGDPKHALDLKHVFASACAARADVGSGWDAPSDGQMTFWAFTEAMLQLAERLKDPFKDPKGESKGEFKGGRGKGGGRQDEAAAGLAKPLAQLLAYLH